MKALGGNEIAWAAQMSCLLEASADKPGNVSPRRDFDDARFEDYAVSALAIGPAFGEAAAATVGETILRSVSDTRRFVSTNTNLGMVLLLAPLAKAAGREGVDGLRESLKHVLRGLTPDDADRAYEAIRRAAPAGMGRVERYDVESGAEGMTLLEAMGRARDRDSVAREYVTDFQICFEVGHEALRREWGAGRGISDTIVQTFLTVLSQVPDTLIGRKIGRAAAEEVSQRAADVLAAGGCLTSGGREALSRLDHDLRDERHRMNPGTTADLVAGSLFVFLTEGEMLGRAHELMDRR